MEAEASEAGRISRAIQAVAGTTACKGVQIAALKRWAHQNDCWVNDSNLLALIPNARDIIDTRDRIIHAYDNVRPEFLWGLVVRHIPELKKDVECILAKYEEQYNRAL